MDFGLKITCHQGDQKIGKKSPNFWKKSGQNNGNAKKAKISTSKLNFKVQIIYIKPLSKPLNTYNKPCFQIAYLGEKCKNSFRKKVAQNVTIFCYLFA
jgi:hypothetical protein